MSDLKDDERNMLQSGPSSMKVMENFLKQMGIHNCDPQVKHAMLAFAYDRIRTILLEARSICDHSGRETVTVEDVAFTVDKAIPSSCSPMFKLELAGFINAKDLPEIKNSAKEILLPSNQHLLLQGDFRHRPIDSNNNA